jgi:glycosyltransferase involved in cell wall biosynthesis
LAQVPRARRLVKRHRFCTIHRVNPCWVGDPTLLTYLKPPIVLGPLLISGDPPASFRPLMWREIEHYKSRTSWFRKLRPVDRIAGLSMGALQRRGDHFKKATAILIGTPGTAEKIPEQYRSKCVEIPYVGIDTDLYVPAPVENDLPVILFAGRLTGHKGVELLIRSLGAIKDRVDFRARIVGRGTPFYESYFRQLARELQLDQHVEFVPHMPRTDLMREIQQCDLFCFPSLSDTYGVVLLEAMSCERACLVADIGGPAEIVQDDCGVRVPLENPEQFVRDYGDEIVRLLNDGATRQQLGKNARQLVLKRNRWAVIEDVLHDVYGRIVNDC